MHSHARPPRAPIAIARYAGTGGTIPGAPSVLSPVSHRYRWSPSSWCRCSSTSRSSRLPGLLAPLPSASLEVSTRRRPALIRSGCHQQWRHTSAYAGPVVRSPSMTEQTRNPPDFYLVKPVMVCLGLQRRTGLQQSGPPRPDAERLFPQGVSPKHRFAIPCQPR